MLPGIMDWFDRREQAAKAKARAIEAAKPARDRSIWLHSSDDRLTRAKKIVQAMGILGSVGGLVLAVEEVLATYERLDAEAAQDAEQPTTPDLG